MYPVLLLYIQPADRGYPIVVDSMWAIYRKAPGPEVGNPVRTMGLAVEVGEKIHTRTVVGQ